MNCPIGDGSHSPCCARSSVAWAARAGAIVRDAIDGWDLFVFLVGGVLGLGLGIAAVHPDEHERAGWTPPAELHEREAVTVPVIDWPSPARLQRAAGETAAPRPSDEGAIAR
jgi:hypothetical protein